MLRFTIYDFTNSDGQTGVEIEEPIGFDGLILNLYRHNVYKGISFEMSITTIEIDDKIGFQIVKSAYDSAGVNAKIVLKTEYDCSSGFETLFESELNFESYKEIYSDYCAVQIGLQPTNDISVLKKNEDVKVDLETLKGFNGTTNLLPYEYLGKSIELPSKSILFTNSAKGEIEYIKNMSSGVTPSPINNTVAFYIPFELVMLDEYEGFNPLTEMFVTVYPVNSTDYYILQSGKNETYNIVTKFDYEIEIGGTVENYHQLKYQIWKNDTTLLDEVDYGVVTTPFTGSTANGSYSGSVDYNGNVTVSVGDKITVVMYANHYTTSGGGADLITLQFKVKENSIFTITYLDLDETVTNCKQFLLNESFSRIAESVTNDKVRVFSNYLGRTDAQPYTSVTDGLASLKAITKGLFIRQVEKVKENKPIFSVSFKELFQAIDAIDNIGLCFETDVNRPSYQVARIENIDYFFKDEVILDIGEVKLTRQINEKEVYNIFKFGYQKYEAEEYNGLDEFLTKREFRTDLITKNTLEKLCSFIASGYAIEITRRKGNDTSKDWRYDEDTFIVCMKRDGEIVVEQGGIIDDENIIDPSTILNYRISPIRNAMRWIREVFRGYKDQTKVKLIFSSGDGNYYAKGLYTGNILESSAIAENDTITQSSLANLASAMPYISAELDNIQDIGLTYNEYKLIRANPHALIGYSVNGNQQYGYIQDLKYSVLKGSADFLVIPKY